MAALMTEWLHLLVRWMHVIAGIMWIGSSIFFNWLDSHLTRPENAKPGIEGELWMVHSGGFYQVEKKLVIPDKMPKTLHWFKWEAAFTWISGFFLLIIVYYMGGGALLVDSSVSSITPHEATALGIGLLVVSWFAYDALWNSPLENNKKLGAGICFVLLMGIAYGLCHVLSGRAAFLHVGALMGTLMAANVWVRIIPAQKHLVASTIAGTKADARLAAKAKQRSRHNNYMTYPVIIIMLSNHFPGTYGSPVNWMILGGLILLGAGIRHYMNTGDRSPRVMLSWVGAAALVAIAIVMTPAISPLTPASTTGASDSSLDAAHGGPKGDVPGIDLASAGSIHGQVKFEGTVPSAMPINLPAGCAEQFHAGVTDTPALVNNGRLQNAFVWISQGLDAMNFPAPAQEVTVDQRGCFYSPRVIGAQVGQNVTFVNSDPVIHNVRAMAKENPPFNEVMVAKNMRLTRAFQHSEIMVRSKCDVHPWMSAFIGVLPHPYFAVTGANGEFFLDRIPPGQYTLEAWHEVFGRKSQKITVTAKGAIEAGFVFQSQ